MQGRFSRQFALNCGNGIVYSMIPKNACSTLRLSIAITRGFINDVSEYKWIHFTWSKLRAERIRGLKSFVVLRNPFDRVASVFLNKLAYLRDETVENLPNSLGGDDISFSQFVRALQDPKTLQANVHWAPQYEFLFQPLHRYDLVTTIHDIDHVFEWAGLQKVDARPYTQHGTDQFDTVSGDFFNVSAKELKTMMSRGQCPTYKGMYNCELRHIIGLTYKHDFNLLKMIGHQIGEK